MKKKSLKQAIPKGSCKKLLRIMKLTLLCLFLGTNMLLANLSYAQTTSLDLNLKNVTLEDVFDAIRKQSEFEFFYNDDQVDTSVKINVKAKGKEVTEILDNILPNQYEYKINDRYILVSKKKEALLNHQTQQIKRKISGTIIDEQGQPLIGVNVVVKGTTTGISTDINGHFTLEIPENSNLEISYLGYINQEILTKNLTVFNIVLKEDSQALDEIVVVGYGVQRKASVTGSVASIDNKDIIKAPLPNLTNTLGGRLPGLRVISRSGEPGWSDSEIDIRGFGNALIIVDGTPNSFSQIDPNEIETISILKDASAAVYGVQAANGVILVTTKRGKEGATNINFSSTFSWQQPTIFPKPVNAAEFVELTDEDKINRGEEPLYGQEELEKWRIGGPGYENTDWHSLVIRPWTPMQQYNLNIRGGKEDLKFFTSIGYVDQEGMWKSGSTNFNRFNFRSNIDAVIKGGLSASISISGRKEKRNNPSTSAGYIMSSIIRTYPTYSPFANGNKEYLSETNAAIVQPLAISNKDISGSSQSEIKVFEGSSTLNYDASSILKGLSAKAIYYYRVISNNSRYFNKKYDLYKYNEANEEYYSSYTGNSPSNLTKDHLEKQYKTFQASINYSNVFLDKHVVDGLLLFETRQAKENVFNAYREFSIDSIEELDAGTENNKNNSGTSINDGNIGYIGRLNYAFDNRLLFELSFRYDGSSKFAPDSRWGFFPSVSAGWRISEEKFIKDKIQIIDNLKIRTSWGRLGDDSGVKRFQYLTGYTYPSGSYIFGDNVISTLTNKGMSNTGITWFTSDLYNIGLDFSLWNRLFEGEVDIFYRKRNGLLATRAASLPGTFGSNLPEENLNSDSDKGFELSLKHTNILENGFEYNIKGNISYTRSKNNHIERSPSIHLYDNWRNNSNSRWKNIYWGYKAIGQFQSYEEIAQAPVQDGKGNMTLRPGDIRYYDYNGDNVIDNNDEHIIGRGNKPEIMLGFDINIAWKGFDVAIFLQGALNFNAYFNEELQNPFRNAASSYKAFTNRWHRKDLYDPNSEWVSGKYPSTYADGSESNRKVSSFWLQDASYLRIKDIQVGYTLPKRLLNRLSLNNLRFFISGYNLVTFTKLDLLDPEAPAGRGQFYPQQKVLSCGLNLTL